MGCNRLPSNSKCSIQLMKRLYEFLTGLYLHWRTSPKRSVPDDLPPCHHANAKCMCFDKCASRINLTHTRGTNILMMWHCLETMACYSHPLASSSCTQYYYGEQLAYIEVQRSNFPHFPILLAIICATCRKQDQAQISACTLQDASWRS